MLEILNNIYIDKFLFVAFFKYISSQIWNHVFGRLWNIAFEEKYF